MPKLAAGRLEAVRPLGKYSGDAYWMWTGLYKMTGLMARESKNTKLNAYLDIGHFLLDIGHSSRVLRYAQDDKLRFVHLLKLEIGMEAARESKNAKPNASLDIGHSRSGPTPTWTLDISDWTLDISDWTLDIPKAFLVGHWTFFAGHWTFRLPNPSICLKPAKTPNKSPSSPAYVCVSKTKLRHAEKHLLLLSPVRLQ